VNIRYAVLLAVIAGMTGGCTHTYFYRITNEGCNCRVFASTDSTHHITYRVTAQYRVGSRIRTEIDLTIINAGPDTLQLADTFVKVASRNVPYPANNRYLPVGVRFVPPQGQRTLTLSGEFTPQGDEDPWLRIAGEEVTVTMEGQSIHNERLAKQEMQLIPENPYLVQ
jgi:hypothetical protein